MNEEAERREKLIAEAKRAKRNAVSPKSATPATLTTGDRGDEEHCLNFAYWKDKTIWEIYQIPYLFLGYEPKPYNSRLLDDVIDLDEQEGKRYDQYYDLIKDAIDSGALICDPSARTPTTPLRASDIKTWRKTVDFIKPAKIYLDMEDAITESPSNANNNKQLDQEEQTGFRKFENMENLTWNEVELIILANGKIKISARGNSIIKHNSFFELTGKQYEILLKLAAKEKIKSNERESVTRVRKTLKNIMGIQKDPFEKYSKDIGYKPIFKLSEKVSGSIEKHGAAFRDNDGLDAKIASGYDQNKPLPIDVNYKIGSNKMDADADAFLKEHDED